MDVFLERHPVADGVVEADADVVVKLLQAGITAFQRINGIFPFPQPECAEDACRFDRFTVAQA